MPDSKNIFVRLYHRDLDRVSNELKAIPDERLWEIRAGVINSSGVLAQHLIGNLHHFIGAQLGNTGYQREREREFSNTGASSEELINQIEELKQTISTVLSSLSEEEFDENIPDTFPFQNSVNEGLMHLYGHLNYHLGQINYLRRIIEEKG